MIVSKTTEGIKVEYQEPSTNATGTALTDLALTSIYYDKGAGAVKAMDVPASSPAGGGQISQIIQVEIPANEEADIKVWATATDLSGNLSLPSDVVTVRVDNLPPAPPL